jgi:EAL domain-containing protein (putative c-di-GMP-specific phosphodiesterase class I)
MQRRRLTGFEALIRWKSPIRGNVPPIDFVPFAEEIGMMEKIGDWVLRTACLEVASWPAGLKVSVNLSPAQLHSPAFVERLVTILHETKMTASRLELEVTETAMIDDIAGAATILHQLRKLGLQIALDDFGTGYSSLSFLHTLPFTRIKIDRSFVANLGVKPEATAIVRAVAGLCGNLGVAATAEGVETEEQARLLQIEGCHEIQGYLIGRPCPVDEVHDWITSWGRDGGISAMRARFHLAISA